MTKAELINLHKNILIQLETEKKARLKVSEIDNVKQVLNYFNEIKIYNAYLSTDTDYIIIE
jgi:hypothetical protein